MASTSTITAENLQAAFHGESNACARYRAFAGKADEEGYGPVATLFRAAARAEEIHAANHAAVMAGMGVTPQVRLETPVVKSTSENLQAAIEGEIYERDVMYPDFIARARMEGSDPAINTFTLAKDVEAEHARLYSKALSELASLRGAGTVYYVCPICGFTSTHPDFDLCPVCSGPVEDYEEIR